MADEARKVTKLEAAWCQLRQAIVLFFEDGDMISVHTLAAAAQQVLIDLGAKAGLVSIVKNQDLIQPEHRKFVSGLMNSAQNFFKHADKDPDATLEFFPASTPFYLMDAVVLYRQLNGSSPPAAKAFEVWFSLNYPHVLADGVQKDYVQKLVNEDPKLGEKRVALKLLRHLEK
jgi:hypothetical protein